MSDVLQAVRAKYPVYKDVPDDQLAKAIGSKYPQYLESDPKFKLEYDEATATKYTEPVKTNILKSPDANIIPDLTGPRSTTYGGPPKQIAPMSEAVSYAEQALTQKTINLPSMEIKPDDSPASAVGKEAYNLAASIPNFMGTPIGVASTAAGGAIPKTVAGVFSALGIKSVGETILNSYRDWFKMTPSQKWAAMTDVVGGTALSGLMAKVAIPRGASKVAPATAAEVQKSVIIPPKPTETITAAAVKTPEGVVTAANHPEAEKAAGMPKTTREERNTPQYGYQTTEKEFVTRPEAEKIAEQSDQLISKPKTPNQPHSDEIASEPGSEVPLGESNVPVTKPSKVLPEGIDYGGKRTVEQSGVKLGMTLNKSDLPEVEAQIEKAKQDFMAANIAKDEKAMTQAYGRQVFLGEVREGINKKGPNYDLYRQRTKSATAPKPAKEPAAPAGRATTEQPAAVAVPRNWELYEENLVDELDSYSPARHTGKVDYDLMDVAGRFVKYAKEYHGNNPLSKLITEFSRTDDASPSQIRKLRGAVKSMESNEPAAVSKQSSVAVPTIKSPLKAFGKSYYKNPAGEWRQKGKPSAKVNQSTVEALEQLIAPKPAMVGMGGALKGEVESGSGADIYGVAQRIREERAKAGVTAPIAPGEGVSDIEAVRHGQQLLAKDPNAAQKALDKFNADRSISYDAFSAVRAKGESMAQSARQVEQKFGTESTEYLDALESMVHWEKASKEMQTEWHRTGMAQQLATDIDTGDPIAMEAEYKSSTGKTFTPQQRVDARKMSNLVNSKRDKAIKSDKAFTEQFELKLGDPIKLPQDKGDVQKLFMDAGKTHRAFLGFKTGQKFTPQQIKLLWSYAKQFYYDQGIKDFDLIRNGIAKDLGLKVNDVTRCLAENKTMRELADDRWRKATDLRRVKEQAKRWLMNQKFPWYEKFIRQLPSRFFGLKVGFHGTVAAATHAPSVAFQPEFARVFWRNFGRMYHMVGDPAFYEQKVQDLINDPHYVLGRKAGLQSDPFRYQDDYQNPEIAQYFGRLQGMGNRGYFMLKTLRQDMFNQIWDGLNESDRVTPEGKQNLEMAKAIAEGVNHATGVVQAGSPRGASLILFAPKLKMAQAAWLFRDPIKAANIFAKWKDATPAERMFARRQVMEKAQTLGMLWLLLKANDEVNKEIKSEHRVNFTDPTKPDWLQFKVGGMRWVFGSSLLSMSRLPAGFYKIIFQRSERQQKFSSSPEESYQKFGQYWRGQLSPIMGSALDQIFGSDYMGRPLPEKGSLHYLIAGENPPLPASLRREGYDAYTPLEYYSQQLLPIPFAEAAKEAWGTQGISNADQTRLLKSLITLGIMGGTGARGTEDYGTE